MTSRLLPLLATAALAACANTIDIVKPQPADPVTPIDAAQAIDLAARRLAATEPQLWPGFDPHRIPLAIYDSQRTWLFRHPSPPPTFQPLVNAKPDVLVASGKLPEIVANSSAEIGGMGTATLLITPDQAIDAEALAAVAIHEAFHVFQRARHPGWSGNEADLFTYPDDSPKLLALQRLELRALERALSQAEREQTMCWTRQALQLRKQRYAAMEPAHAAYERGTELNEGLATYVELRARKRLSPQFPTGEFGPDQVRQRAYVTGAALAFLLDRFRPNWAVTFATEDSQSLDAALETAVGTSAACAPDETAFAAASTRAKADIQQHQHQRAQRLGAFHGSAGWKVVIESAPSAPLWPQGFDPLNVERVDAKHILHKRYLKLGNDNGYVEIMGTPALTEGFGPHPLFQGIRELVIPGLPEPATRTTGHKVEVNAGTMKAAFEPATATVSGTTVTIRLGKR